MSMSAYDTFIHMAFCGSCRRWFEVCGRRDTMKISEEGTWFPLPQGEDRRRYLCEYGQVLVDGRDDR